MNAVPDENPYDDPMFNRGVTLTVELLAKELGVTDWVAGDGSEDYEQDLAQTLLNIVEAKGLYNSEDGSWAALPLMGVQREDVARAIAGADAPKVCSWEDMAAGWQKVYLAQADAVLSLPHTGQPQEGCNAELNHVGTAYAAPASPRAEGALKGKALEVSREWCLEAARREGDSEVGAGPLHPEAGVTFCYVTYRQCDKNCLSREECALGVAL